MTRTDGPTQRVQGEAGGEGERRGGNFDDVVSSFLRDPGLWPVLCVLVLVLATFVATLLVLAVRGRNPWAIGGVFVLIFASVGALDRDVRARRLTAVGGLVLSLWVAVVAVAIGLVKLGGF